MLAGQTNKKLDRELDALISLNISHLHDAANYFALLKNQIDNGEDHQQLRKFSKGAAYHFRALFEELKAAKEMLSDKNSYDLSKFYSKELIDLKDLLEIELLESSSRQRIKLSDNSKSPRAIIEANFGLLSKLILNIVENALKYSKTAVDIELSETTNHYLIRINSYGASIPDYIVADLKNSKGHGLSSAASIIKFHAASLEILSLSNEGSSIIIKFNKSQRVKPKPKVKQKKQSKLGFITLLTLAIFLSATAIRGYIEQRHSSAAASHIKPQAISFQENIKDLEEAYVKADKDGYKASKHKILSNIQDRYKPYAHYALIKSTNSVAPKALSKKIKAPDLILLESDLALSRGEALKSIKLKLLALYYCLMNNNKDYQICKQILSTKGLNYYLSAVAKKAPKQAPIKKPELHNHRASVNKDTEQANNKDEFTRLNTEIEKLDASLGLNLQL